MGELPEEKKMFEERLEQDTTKDESADPFIPAKIATHEPDEEILVKIIL
jgi:hypothetical protein